MGGITGLYKQLPKRKQPARQAQAKVLRETPPTEEPSMGHSASVAVGHGPSTVLTSPKTKTKSKRSSAFGSSSTKKDKRPNTAPFNFEKERPEVLQTIAASSVASTNLLNALKLVNRETHRVSEDGEVMNQFEKSKTLRRQILRYIQHIESGELLGSLIHANEELVTGLMAFEVLDKSVDYDSDSEEEHVYSRGIDENFAGLSVNPPKPPRPPRPTSLSSPSSAAAPTPLNVNELESASESEEEDDNDDNPFGDKNAVRTPAVEKGQPTW
jgi:hypothetical protein